MFQENRIGFDALLDLIFYLEYSSFDPGQVLLDAFMHDAMSGFDAALFLALIAAARTEQKQFIKEPPNDKPPWIEGDLFTSSWEGATSYSTGKARVGKTTAEVDVH